MASRLLFVAFSMLIAVSYAMKCPVCDMDVDTTSAAVTLKYGQKIYACSTDHANEIAGNPKTFVDGTENQDDASEGMPMFFFASTNVIILFKTWHTTGWGSYIGSCIAIIAMCVLHEYLTTVRANLSATKSKLPTPAIFSKDEALNSLLPSPPSAVEPDVQRRIHLIKTLMYGVSLVFAYLLMLITMTMNVGLFLIVPIGLMIGYYFFGPLREHSTGAAESSDCCHAQ
eukprot:GILK01006445.1.p1 GENE.GILK01006445.1~~GILK01006445.1.p1  ORF type:complete len:228 (+),score=22.33 GILK01006445.1:53-736(+)